MEETTYSYGDLVFFDGNPGVVASKPYYITLDGPNRIQAVDVLYEYEVELLSTWVSDLMTADQYRKHLLTYLQEMD